LDNFFKKIMSPGFLLKLKIGAAVAGFAIVLIVFLIVGAALLSPLDAVLHVFEKGEEIVERLGNAFTMKGWKLDAEVEMEEEREFYEELERVKQKYLEKYNVEIDTNLIIATLFYNRDIKGYLQEYSECIRSDSDECDGLPEGHHDYHTAMKQIQILASFQVATNVYVRADFFLDNLFGKKIKACGDVTEIHPNSDTAREVADNDLDIEFGFDLNGEGIDGGEFNWKLLSWETNARLYYWSLPEDECNWCVTHSLELDCTMPIRVSYSVEPQEVFDDNAFYGVYYWNLIDETPVGFSINGEGNFIDDWFKEFLASRPNYFSHEQKKRELVSNIYDYARVTAGYNAYKGGGSTLVGEESFGSIDFVSRNESIEGLDDSFYTTMSNPFYAAGIKNSYNPYQCTTFVYGRVSEVLAESGKSGSLKVSGNAGDWLNNNYAYSSSTNSGEAKKGAIAVFGGGAEGYGHVVFIENVNPDGTIDFSEGNVRNTGNKYGYRYTSGVDPTSSGFRNLYGLEFQGFIFPFD